MSTNNRSEAPDPEDMFAETRMSFGDHIEDLRAHLIRAIVGFVVGMALSLWPLGHWVLRIIVTPVEDQLEAFEKRKLEKDIKEAREKFKFAGIRIPVINTKYRFKRDEMLEVLKLKPKEEPVLQKMVGAFEQVLLDLDAVDLLDEAVRRDSNFVELDVQVTDPQALSEDMQRLATKIRRPRLSTMNITEAFMVYFKVAMMTGLVISSPWVFYHLWMFIAAGLYPTEKRLVNVYLPFSLFLFISGVLLCQFLVIPRAVEAMLWFNEWLGMSADLRLNEWLGFALLMPIVFGVSFQTPLVMMFLNKVGILDVQMFRDYRKISWFVMAVFAVIIVPSPDAVSMIFLWLPMGGLYELGILLCVWQGGPESLLGDWEKEEKANEMVEV